MRRIHGSLLRVALALMTLASAGPLAAQSVRGQLVDQANGLPIAGGFVVLVNERGDEVARALTGDGGAFRLEAPGPGTYRLQSKRIGFRVSQSPAFELAEGQTLGYRLAVEAVPAQLPAVIVEGRPQCGTRGEQGTVVAELWEDTREALAAVRWTQGQQRYNIAIDLYERELDAYGRRVLDQRAWSRSGSWETPFRSIPAESLVAVGYVVGDDRRGHTFYGPDPDVLLSDAFLETHCFTAREGAGNDSGLVGLAFTPTPRRRLADIRGVLWVGRRSAELRSLEYDYVNLPESQPEGTVGGHEEFMRLGTGAWVILHWRIRMPRVAEVVDPSGRRLPEYTVVGYRETGGQVSAIRSSGGRLLYSSEQAVLEGTVVDSSRGGMPLAGATVSLAGTPYGVRADARGHFQLSASIEGTYDVVFAHPRLDSLGGRLAPRSVTLARGARTSVALAVPTESSLVSRLCPQGLADGERVLVGVVRDAGTAAPIAGASVHAAWRGVTGVRGALESQRWEATSTADDAGGYALCGIPATRITLDARSGAARSRDVVLRFSADGVWIDERRYRSASGRIWTADLVIAP